MSQQALFILAYLLDHYVCVRACVPVYMCVPAPTKSLISQTTVVVSSPYNGAVVTATAVTGDTDRKAKYVNRVYSYMSDSTDKGFVGQY